MGDPRWRYLSCRACGARDIVRVGSPRSRRGLCRGCHDDALLGLPRGEPYVYPCRCQTQHGAMWLDAPCDRFLSNCDARGTYHAASRDRAGED